jgi:hypothetical protein
MSLDVLSDVLGKSLLDRETKLAIVDIVARTPDEELVNDLIDLLGAWKVEDAEAAKSLLHKAETLEMTVKQKIPAKLASRPPSESDAERQKKIAALREKIKGL